MKKSISKAWSQYEAGLDYKRSLGLYETIRRNERFYRGDQWYGSEAVELPKPVFNVTRRIVDHLICVILSGNVSINFTDESLPYARGDEVEHMRAAVEMLGKNAAYRWEQLGMDGKVYRLLRDAAISGDGVIYCYWNPDIKNGQGFSGDIAAEIIDNVNLFVADVNKADIQSQDYVILSGRQSVGSLRDEARRFGVSESDIAMISADGDTDGQSGDMAAYELRDEESEKATYIIKFWREDGRVVFEKSTRECVINRRKTGLSRYPVAYFNWYPTKNSFHGTSPISGMIPNQKFINRAFAMAMKHMTDTAFSKVIYDKTKIPEWSNEVGEAIAAVGGTNVSDAVSVVGVGEMQEGYLELIELAVTMTKEMMGATESALGDGEATNTSAILALQEASRLPLEQIRRNYYQCIEDMANIWVDMICAYYPDGRLLPFGESVADVNISRIRHGLIRARVEVGEIARYSTASTLTMLNRLLDGGHITVSQYVSRLPSGIIGDKAKLLEELRARESEVSVDG